MEKQVLAIAAVFLFCLLYTVAIAAQERDQRVPNAEVAPIKTEVNKLGFGKRVKVKLHDGRKTSGRITGLAENHFVVTDSKGTASAIAYSEVLQVTTQKEKLGILDKPWKGIMFTAAGVGTVTVVAMRLLD